MYLVDTNVWLERMLDQARSEDVGRFLARTPGGELFVSDFGFHSIGVVMHRLDRLDALTLFAHDVFARGGVVLVRLEPDDTERLVRAMREFRLDYDDAYQYVAAEKHDLEIVSFDADFDRTPRRRRTPAEILQART